MVCIELRRQPGTSKTPAVMGSDNKRAAVVMRLVLSEASLMFSDTHGQDCQVKNHVRFPRREVEIVQRRAEEGF